METSEERKARLKKQKEQTEKWIAEREQERLARPLVERLRDSGPFVAGDGHMSYATGNYKDAHEAADRIEELERQLKEIK